jgi:hypothetical protein
MQQEEVIIEEANIRNDSVSSKQNHPLKDKPITDLIFLDQTHGILQFKVVFEDGRISKTDNRELRKYRPELLLDFYERHISVSFN